MAKVDLEQIFEQVATRLMTLAGTDLPAPQEKALRDARERETVTAAQAQLDTMLKNVELARTKCSSICQDPGIPVFNLDIGSNMPLHFDVRGALARATAKVTADVPLRQNICHPLTKINTTTNTGNGIPFIWYDYLPGADYVDVTAQLKGGDAAFRSMVFSLAPTAPRVEGIKKIILDHVAMAGGIPCPPTVVGVGLGGTPDIAMKLAFDALRRYPVASPHPNADMAAIERELYDSLNSTGIGAMGMGGDTTVLGVHVEFVDSHIATHPVAIAFSCWPNRVSKARIYADGRVDWLTHKEEN